LRLVKNLVEVFFERFAGSFVTFRVTRRGPGAAGRVATLAPTASIPPFVRFGKNEPRLPANGASARVTFPAPKD
jgi:hypothetical protein